MAADRPDVAQQTGQTAQQTEEDAGNVITTTLSGFDAILIALIIVIVASLILTLVYGRQMLSNIGLGLTSSGVNPLEQFFNGIASAIQAAFARLAKWINPGGYVIMLVYLKYKIVEGVFAFKAHVVLLIQ